MNRHKHKKNCCDPKDFGFGPKGVHMSQFFCGPGSKFGHSRSQAYQTTSNGDLVITVLTPGILKESIKIRAKTDKMTLKAQRKPELNDVFGNEDVHLVIDLDESVIPDSAKANYVDGVLTITFPLETPGYEVEDINYE